MLIDYFLKLRPCDFLRNGTIARHPIHGEQEQRHESIHPEEVELRHLALVIVISHS